jgi:hypothetical protein
MQTQAFYRQVPEKLGGGLKSRTWERAPIEILVALAIFRGSQYGHRFFIGLRAAWLEVSK